MDRLGLNPAGVWLFRLRAERRPELPPKLPLQLHPQLHPLHGFCTVFSCFRSCLSGDVRPLRSEGNIRQFFGGWFGQVGLEPCWGLPWICLAFTGLESVVLTGRMTKVAPCAVLACAATKAFTLLPYPCGCSTSFPFRRFVFALYFASSLRRLDLRCIHYMVFAWFFHAFEAACLVMSGIGVGLSSSFLGRQKATLGSFSGAGFWTGWA